MDNQNWELIGMEVFQTGREIISLPLRCAKCRHLKCMMGRNLTLSMRDTNTCPYDVTAGSEEVKFSFVQWTNGFVLFAF